MKTTFTLNPSIARMLLSSGFETDRIENSVHGALVKAQLEKSKTERTDVKLSESKSKGDNVTFAEQTNDAFRGEANGPTRFAAWHDAQVSVWKKHGEPSDEIDNLSIVPSHLCVWLAKFRPVATTVIDKTDAAPSNGRADKGGVSEVKTPEPAGAAKK